MGGWTRVTGKGEKGTSEVPRRVTVAPPEPGSWSVYAQWVRAGGPVL